LVDRKTRVYRHRYIDNEVHPILAYCAKVVRGYAPLVKN
jgi:hypothetical protein